MTHIHGAARTAASHHAMTHHASHVAHNTASHLHKLHKAAPALAKGAIATTTAAAVPTTRNHFMSIFIKHPFLVFGLGLAAGYMIHKYRKEIVASATRVGEQSKDFVLNQKENLEDLVAECKECADEEGTSEVSAEHS